MTRLGRPLSKVQELALSRLSFTEWRTAYQLEVRVSTLDILVVHELAEMTSLSLDTSDEKHCNEYRRIQ